MFASENHAVRIPQFGHRTCLGWLLARDCEDILNWLPRKMWHVEWMKQWDRPHFIYVKLRRYITSTKDRSGQGGQRTAEWNKWKVILKGCQAVAMQWNNWAFPVLFSPSVHQINCRSFGAKNQKLWKLVNDVIGVSWLDSFGGILLSAYQEWSEPPTLTTIKRLTGCWWGPFGGMYL